MKDYFKYRYLTNIEFNLKPGEYLCVLGNSISFFLDTLINNNDECNVFVGDTELNNENIYNIRKKIGFVLNKHLHIFVGETLKDEIAYGLESLAYTKDDITTLIDSLSKRFKLNDLLERDPNSLGSSDLVKLKILSALIVKPNVLILENVLCELDLNDRKVVQSVFNEYLKNGGIIINLTNNVEETLDASRIIILNDNSLVCDGKTISVLNEEKLLKRLGIGLPFIVELNKYFMDYGMVDKYYLNDEKLVGALWK